LGCIIINNENRDTPAYAIYWVANEWCKTQLMRLPGIDEPSPSSTIGRPSVQSVPVAVSLAAGGFSGVVTWLVAYPFDPVKSVIQTAPLNTPRSQISMWHVAKVYHIIFNRTN
jgi:hypothetical protein